MVNKKKSPIALNTLSNTYRDERSKYATALVDDTSFTVVDPSYFYSKPVPGMGLGLFCKIDLIPGDIWWAHNLEDQRYVEALFSWEDFLRLEGSRKEEVQRKCYVDVETRAVIVCTEPFCRVNHGNDETANSDSDQFKNSLITKPVPADQQILISYNYEAVISLIWKFDTFKSSVPNHLLSDDSFLFSCATDVPIAADFLNQLR